MKYVFDLDQTLCITEGNQYSLSKPIYERIEIVNCLYSDSQDITIYTSRGMNSFNGDIEKCYNEYYVLTLNQLQDWGVKFDRLILGKRSYDFFIDDKAINDKEFFKK